MTILPKISIVTPSLNQGDFLEETILSVIDQGYPNLEYIVIDGGSTDNSAEIINKYSKHLHYWISEPDKGHAHALNKGFQQTSGDIMAWINSDDKYLPWTFKTVAEIFSTFPETNWIVGFNAWWSDQGVLLSAKQILKNIYDFLALDYNWIQQESTFWTRQLWDNAGGYINQDYKFMVDGELWTRFFPLEKLYAVECILGGYRSHKDNRAKHNYHLCCNEMDKAIQTMASNCDANTLKKHHNLLFLKKMRQHEILNKYTSHFFKKIYQSLLEETQYDIITYKNGSWDLHHKRILDIA